MLGTLLAILIDSPLAHSYRRALLPKSPLAHSYGRGGGGEGPNARPVKLQRDRGVIDVRVRGASQILNRSALSLLEVVLALSILGVATGILSSIMQQAADNGLKSRRMTQAQMVCEAKMAEAISGALPLQATQWTPTSSLDGTAWYYALELVPAEIPNMVGIAVSINDETAMNESSSRPLARLVQWIIDPNLGLDTKPVTDTTSTDGSGGTSTTTSGTGASP